MPRRAIGFLVAGVVLVALAFATTPIIAPSSVLARAAALAFAGLCHQNPARSIVVDDHAMAICHRCSGLYLGIALGALMAALGVRVRVRSLVGWGLAIGALGGHVALGWIAPAIFDWSILRVISGLVFGAWSGAALAVALADVPHSPARGAIVGGRALQPDPRGVDP